jgi:hypothetical protein
VLLSCNRKKLRHRGLAAVAGVGKKQKSRRWIALFLLSYHVVLTVKAVVLRLVEPFAHPCTRSTTAAQRRDSGPPPEFLSKAPSNPLRLPVAN